MGMVNVGFMYVAASSCWLDWFRYISVSSLKELSKKENKKDIVW